MTQPRDSGTQGPHLDLNIERRRKFLARCNETLRLARGRLVRNCPKVGGIESSRRFTAEIDELLRDIYSWLTHESRLTTEEYAGITVLAQGGYGRAELSLHSDVDLLLLMPDSSRPVEQAFVRSYLHLLWDLGNLDIGYATKRLNEALGAVGTDLDSTTALVETRPISGGQAVVDTLRKRFRTLLHGPLKEWFIEAQLAQWKSRREKYGSSVYLLEPNVKDGEGGLRDIHSVQWLSYVVLGTGDLDGLVHKDILTGAERRAVDGARDFILSVRTVLHHLEGRKSDVLGFERQPEVAKALGYVSDAQLLAEEKLMKDYYLHARTIDRYCQKATRALTTRSRTAIGGMFDAMRRRSLNEHYQVKNGALFLKPRKSEFFTRDAARIMECFHVAASSGTVLSDELKDQIQSDRALTSTEEFRTSPRSRDSFLRLLALKSGVAQSLHAMHETAVLGDYIPEFAQLFCLVRIDYYHRYTVDEHLLKTVEVAEKIVNSAPDQRPELVKVASEIQRWDLLNLALLLHDIGKGEGRGHVLRGGILSQKIMQRMGLPSEDQEVVRQLILLHLKMVHVSQRRDLDDPHVIREMAEAVGGLEQLKMLYVLTASDMQAVGPGVYTEWKASLLYDLYRKTALMLEGKDPLQPMDEDSYGRVVQAVTTEAEGNCDETEVRRFLDNMPEKYLNSVPPAKIAMHMRMARQLSGSNRIVWEIEEPESLNYTEITAVSFDVPGLMSYVCGALSSKEVNILGVQAFSSKDGYAIDTFQVTDLRGNRLPQGFRLDRLRADLNSLLMGRAKASDVFHTRRRARLVNADRVALRPANISLDNEKSSKFTTLEIHTFDRPGLLYRITATCAKAGYYIHLAMITTEAYHVVDVFYLTDLEFNKLDPQQMKRLQAALEAELQQL